MIDPDIDENNQTYQDSFPSSEKYLRRSQVEMPPISEAIDGMSIIGSLTTPHNKDGKGCLTTPYKNDGEFD